MKINQKGALDFMLIAVLVVILAAGALVFMRISEADEAVSNTEVVALETRENLDRTQDKKDEAEATSTVLVTNETLEIPELGVQVRQPVDIGNLEYTLSSEDNTVYLSPINLNKELTIHMEPVEDRIVCNFVALTFYESAKDLEGAFIPGAINKALVDGNGEPLFESVKRIDGGDSYYSYGGSGSICGGLDPRNAEDRDLLDRVTFGRSTVFDLLGDERNVSLLGY